MNEDSSISSFQPCSGANNFNITNCNTNFNNTTNFNSNNTIDENNRKRKERKRTSPVYDHSIVDKQKNTIKCMYCPLIYVWSGVSSNMKKHLKTDHNIKLKKKGNKDNSNDNSSDDSSDDSNDDNYSGDISSAKRPRRLEQHDIDILDFFVKNYIPFSAVESAEFKRLIKHFDKDYETPSRFVLSNRLLDNRCEEISKLIQDELNYTEFISLTIDLWKSSNNYPYIGITAHFFDLRYNLKNRTISLTHLPGTHSNETISEAVLNIIIKWRIQNKVVAMVLDNAQNVKNVATIVSAKLNTQIANTFESQATASSLIMQQSMIEQFGCNAHILNLIVQVLDNDWDKINLDKLPSNLKDSKLNNNDLVELKKYENLISKAKQIVTSVHQSTILLEVLHEYCEKFNIKKKTLIQDVAHRWNSSFLMLERIAELFEAINEALRDSRIKHYDYVLSGEDRLTLIDTLNVLCDFLNSTEIFSKSKYISISTVLPIYHLLSDSTELDYQDNNYKSTLKKVLNHTIRYYYNTYVLQNESTLALATFLDLNTRNFPYANNKARKELRQKAIDKIINLCKNDIKMKKYVEKEKSSQASQKTIAQSNTLNDEESNETVIFKRKPLALFNLNTKPKVGRPSNNVNKSQIDLEIDRYERILPCQLEPNKFWQDQKENYPCLFYCFKRLLCIPASSVPAEQLFSTANYNIWDRRNRLAPERAEKIILLNSFTF